MNQETYVEERIVKGIFHPKTGSFHPFVNTIFYREIDNAFVAVVHVQISRLEWCHIVAAYGRGPGNEAVPSSELIGMGSHVPYEEMVARAEYHLNYVDNLARAARRQPELDIISGSKR